ncbi:MAG: ATP-binding cassette domain-containing protein [Porphyromonadaceae bacterium]|nr:ATP-binding cassette domain-containing protein [Porphyromonadaceae bacterium]
MLFVKINVKQLSKAKKQLFIRHHINYLFRNYALIDDESVQKNLELTLYYDHLSKDKKNIMIHKVLSAVGLSGYENKMVYTLSGGEQ